MKDIAEGAMEHLDSAKRQVKSSMQSISDCADDAWNKVMGDATVRSGVETLRQGAGKGAGRGETGFLPPIRLGRQAHPFWQKRAMPWRMARKIRRMLVVVLLSGLLK